MSESRFCPHCGSALPAEIEGNTFESIPSRAPEVGVKPDPKSQEEASFPMIPLLAPGSNDDDFMSRAYGKRLSATEPDPILGEFITPASSELPVFPKPGGSDAPAPARRSGSGENFPTINLDAPVVTSLGLVSASKVRQGELADGEDDEIEGRRRAWPGILLASYASAMTLALAWTLLKDRTHEKLEKETTTSSQSPSPTPAPNVIVSDSPRQSDLSRVVLPPEPILGEHFAAIGQTIKVGLLEITPIDVRRQDVRLKRSNQYASSELRDGGKKALVLRLKLRNTSPDTVFAPLDQAYLRERGKQLVDTFVTTADGVRVYPFPLAVDSELSIVGQDLTELRPGESRTVAIVTAPDAPPDDAGPFTWRVRLRTGVDRTDLIGVRWPDKPAERAKTPNPK